MKRNNNRNRSKEYEQEIQVCDGEKTQEYGRGFTIIPNVMMDKWLRIIGVKAMAVWVIFRRMSESCGQEVFSRMRQKDWCELLDMSMDTFQKSIRILEKYDLLEVERPKGYDMIQHKICNYIVKEPPTEVPEEALEETKMFSEEHPLNDPIFSKNTGSMFKGKWYERVTRSTKSIVHRESKKQQSIKNTKIQRPFIYKNKDNKNTENPFPYGKGLKQDRKDCLVKVPSEHLSHDSKKQDQSKTIRSRRTIWPDSNKNNIQPTIQPIPEKPTMSERILQKANEKPKKEIKTNSLIEYWNTFTQVRKHRPTSKSYLLASQLLCQLKKGTFSEKNILNKEWLKKQNIPDFYLTRQWSEDQLMRGLEELSKLFVNGYWPQDKNKLPKQLSDLIYNPRTQKSYLLQALFKPIPQITQETIKKQEKKLTDEDQKMYKILSRSLKDIRGFDLSVYESKQLIDNVIAIKYYHSEIDRSDDQIAKYLRTPTKLCEEFEEYLQLCYSDFREIKLIMLRPGSTIWTKFIYHLEDSIGVKICKKQEKKFTSVKQRHYVPAIERPEHEIDPYIGY